MHRTPHGGHLVGALDRPGLLHERLRIHQRHTSRLQRPHADQVEAVHCQALVASAVLGHERGDLVGPAARDLGGSGSGVEVHVGGSRPDLVHCLGVQVQELALGELEHH